MSNNYVSTNIEEDTKALNISNDEFLNYIEVLKSYVESSTKITNASKEVQLAALYKLSSHNRDKVIEAMIELSKNGSEDLKNKILEKISEITSEQSKLEKTTNDTLKEMNKDNNDFWLKLAGGLAVCALLIYVGKDFLSSDSEFIDVDVNNI
ncbi:MULTISPECIES: hypothetical protein [Aliarcobacter]|uniref:hypothetical protein n=1 Tax=Aliarcobacter TaxID=2321111 RepID=UPI0021B4055C|nr:MULTISPECIES: hypothetical protein [Aliarcobacter]MCT7544254.1 hypothetical protein [Aliarcobacter cryaerophilus]